MLDQGDAGGPLGPQRAVVGGEEPETADPGSESVGPSSELTGMLKPEVQPVASLADHFAGNLDSMSLPQPGQW